VEKNNMEVKVPCYKCNKDTEIELDMDEFVCAHCGWPIDRDRIIQKLVQIIRGIPHIPWG
jgi:predicted RNA-binding Zn-ribbon protein involved in translation (DUF1610 family)